MKKTLTHLTGIVFLIAILAAAGCSSEETTPSEPQDKDAEISLVFIYCKAVEKEGELHFTMWDLSKDTIVSTHSSKDPVELINKLVTKVEPGDLVFWQWSRKSEVTEFVKVAPKTPGNIMPGDAKPADEFKKAYLRVPNGVQRNQQESYYIEFIWKGDTVKVDPHLRVPPAPLEN